MTFRDFVNDLWYDHKKEIFTWTGKYPDYEIRKWFVSNKWFLKNKFKNQGDD